MRNELTDEEELAFFKSEEFKKGIEKAINAGTWDLGLPKVYLKDGWIVKHWKDGTIKKIKKIK